MLATDKQHYFDRYWQEQDKVRVSRRAEWRAMKLYQLVGSKYSSFLDIGAGQGEMINYFRSAGYRVEGWDISPEAVARLRENGISARVVDVETDKFDGNFGLIACCEVLQQIEDPAAVLRKFADALLPGGRIFISVPNEYHLLRRLGIGRPVESHVRLFSPHRSRELAQVSGLAIVRVLHQPLVPPRFSRPLRILGQWAANLLPSLFSLSTMLLLKRNHDD